MTINEDGLFELFGWNANNMFFLTRDGDIEITCVKKLLFHYANQCLLGNTWKSKDLDDFGRNYYDKTFIRLCIDVYSYVCYEEEKFKSLSCKKTGDEYIVRLEFGEEILEMELVQMAEYLEQKMYNS
jgi:hypothetical protein